jgi:methylated-DNA-[protein]-cysteine S-methyltransferase
MRRYAILPITRGSVVIVATGNGLSNVILTSRGTREADRMARERFPDAERDSGLLPRLQHGIRDYFAGRRVTLQARLDLATLTLFQRRVLAACADVGYGERATYGTLARRIRKPAAARAVGQALARNPVPLVVPCHRIISRDGSLGGFSAEQGVDLKRRLLRMEAGADAAS